MTEDYPVTVTIDLGGRTQVIPAETAYVGVADDRVLLTEPCGYDAGSNHALLGVGGEEVLMLAGDRDVGIEGPAEAIQHYVARRTGVGHGGDPDDKLDQMLGEMRGGGDG